MLGNGYLDSFIEKEELYKLVDNKLKALGIDYTDYPLISENLVANVHGEKLVVDTTAFPSTAMGGILYKDPEDRRSYIALNSKKSRQSRNFDCMHELIHYWFHPPTPNFCFDIDQIHQDKGVEWQANEGAAQALMPEKLFKIKYIHCRGDKNELSNFFFVSTQAIEYRINNLKLYDLIDLRRIGKKSHDVYCFKCGNPNMKGSSYCSICGSDAFFNRTKGFSWSNYSDGPTVGNRCSNSYTCGIKLDSNARYCHNCGAKSELYEIGEIFPWVDEQLNLLKTLKKID